MLSSFRFPFSYRGLAPHKFTPMSGVPVALHPRHNAGVMVAAGLGRSPVWGRSIVAGQLWSPWDIPRGNQIQREAGNEMYGSRS